MKTLNNRLKYNRLLSFVFFLLMVNTTIVWAQDTLPINLERVLELGGADNLTIKEYKERQKLSQAELAKSKEWWLPELSVGAQTNQLWGAAMNADGRFFLDVNANNLWSGIGLNANWDFAEGIYTAQSAHLKSQARTYLTQAESNQQLLLIIRSYYELLTAQLNYNAYQNLVKQSDSIVAQIQIQVEGGLLYQSELLLAKSNKSHLKVEMFSAKKAYNNASASLKRLLNIEQNVKLASTDKSLLPLDFTSNTTTGQAGVETREDSLYLDRPEMKANELQFQALEIEKKKYTVGLFIPQLRVGTSGAYFGRINGNVSPMFPAEYPDRQQLYPTVALNISLLWKVPLGNLTYQGDKKVFDSKLRLNEIEAKQFKVVINEQLAQAKSDLQLGKEQIETAKEALKFTTEALNQSIERQKLATAKPFEVFQAQQFFLQAQLDYLQAVSDFNQAQYALKVAQGEAL